MSIGTSTEITYLIGTFMCLICTFMEIAIETKFYSVLVALAALLVGLDTLVAAMSLQCLSLAGSVNRCDVITSMALEPSPS